MKILNPYKEFNDSRGRFLGLVNTGFWEEFNFVETNAGQIRGGHYHKKTLELFFIIEGEIKVDISCIGKNQMESFLVRSGTIFLVEPMDVHTFYCITPCKWINVLSKRMGDSTADFFALETRW